MNVNPVDIDTAVSPDALLVIIEQLMSEYLQRTQKGEILDMQLIERGVAAFCERINALPKDEAKKYDPALQHLMQGMTRLGLELQSQQGQLIENLKDVTAVRKANMAYQNSDAIVPMDGMRKRVEKPDSDGNH
jgi:hypothetical protein